jgi:hypothetical protein
LAKDKVTLSFEGLLYGAFNGISGRLVPAMGRERKGVSPGYGRISLGAPTGGPAIRVADNFQAVPCVARCRAFLTSHALNSLYSPRRRRILPFLYFSESLRFYGQIDNS